MESKFEVGQAYVAVPDVGGARRIVVAVRGRTAGTVTFAEIHEVVQCDVIPFEGREVAQIKSSCGRVYTVSSAVEVDVGAVAATMEMLRI